MLDEQKTPIPDQQVMQSPQGQQPPAGSNKKWIALAIGGGCALLACLGLAVVLVLGRLAPQIVDQLNQLVAGGSAAPTSAPGLSTPAAGANPQQSGNTMGDPNAPVKIVEYADFQCPYCREFWRDTQPQIVDNYVKTGKVFYEYRSVGAFIGPESAAAAEAAYCAGDQGKFWEYHDVLFAHWTGENVGDFSTANLRQFAVSLGLDANAFNDCLSNGKYISRVQQDVTNAKVDGVRATPSFLINGKLVEGAQPYAVFQQAIEAALQAK